MLTVKQLQSYMNNRGLIHAVALRMGYRHLDWISKDTDMQAEHWPKYSYSWPVPDSPYDLDDWAINIADALKLEPSYVEYNPILEDPDKVKGIIMVYGYRYHPNKNTPSGWNVVFQYTYVDPTLALM
ncbi:hypothetical protein pEaSNUABM34_00170 [Erwinia phage pEa_SNUABM_34]|nr:hypothetical protein pEaSNUABM34_00170 [Erwinia phage pEa_SNUABM_34]